MKRLLFALLILITALSLFGCSARSGSAPSTEPGITGYVMQRDNDRILVISQAPKDFSANGGVKEFYDAIWFSKAPKDVKIGDRVKVWYEYVAESYPGQSEVKHIEVIASQKPDGADLTESEVLSKALKSKEVNAGETIVAKSISYDAEADVWKVEMKEVMGEKIYNLQIEDK